MKLELKVLKSEQIHQYGALLLPIQRSLLSGLSEDHVVVGATIGGLPVGLAVAELFDRAVAARVLNLFVSKEYRLRGIGTKLLSTLENELERRGVQWQYLGYLPEQPTTAVLEQILKKLSWESPTDHKIIWKAYAKSILEAPWAPPPGWPPGYERFLWSERTAQDQAYYKQMWTANNFPRGLGPHPDDTDFEPLNSLGVRRNGRLVGWLVTKRAAANSIRYAWQYASPEMTKVGRGVPLMRDGLRLQVQELGAETIATAGSIISNTQAVNFVHRRLKPYLLSLVISKQSEKRLRQT